MQIRPNIIVLTIPLGESQVHPVLLVDEDGLTLIDTGMFDQYEALIKAIEEAGEAPSSLKRIILTHQDTDHIGNLPALARQFPGVRLFAHPGDLPVISGSQPMLKMTPERIAQLPPERREAFGRFLEQLKQLPEIEELHDAEQLPWGAGLRLSILPGIRRVISASTSGNRSCCLLPMSCVSWMVSWPDHGMRPHRICRWHCAAC